MSTFSGDAVVLALFGKIRRGLLALFYTRTDETFYTRQIVRALGAGLGGVQRELTRLNEAGILRRTRRGRHVEYGANPDCPVFPELRALMVKTAGVADVLRAALAPLSDRIDVAFVHGSFATGRPRRSSDVDLIVVGSASFGEVGEVLTRAEGVLSREVNASVYGAEEFSRRIADGLPFVQTVVREPKIFLIGSDRELTRVARQRVGTRARAHGT